MATHKWLKSTRHYKECHEHEFPWIDVIRIIGETKDPKKHGNKFEIKTEKYYILYIVTNKTAYVINAKRT